MKMFESLPTRLRWALIVASSLIVVVGAALVVVVLVGTLWLLEEGVFTGTHLVWAALAAPSAALILASRYIRTAGRVKAGLLMVVALRTAVSDASRHARGGACTEVELARAARLNLDQTRRVLYWLSSRRHEGSAVVYPHRRGLYFEFTLARGGEGWAERVLKLVGGI